MQTLTSLCSLRPDFGRNADWLLEQFHRIWLDVGVNESWKRSFLAWLFSRMIRRRRREGFCCLFYSLSSYGRKICLFIFSKLASGRNPRNEKIWLVPRAGGILRSCPITRAESLAASFTSLFVVCEEAKTVIFKTIFLLKLALLLASVREKWIL